MARIRTIKPEFPQSESMGRISRDARLLFIQLWTLCDDSGRARGNSRMLASLLFPYDDDAADLIDDWLSELEEEECIVLYLINGTTYLQICNWLNHQKIDKPSGSKIPEFTEASRIFAKPRERSPLDQGSGPSTKEVDQGPRSSRPPAPPSSDSKGAEEKETALQAACKTTWSSYARGYYERYGTEPVRNAKVNANVKQFVQRIGAEEAPLLAAWFVQHSDAWYVRKVHDFGSLLADCEKLRTQWATGRQVTATAAMQADRTASNFQASQEALAILQAKGLAA